MPLARVATTRRMSGQFRPMRSFRILLGVNPTEGWTLPGRVVAVRLSAFQQWPGSVEYQS